MTNTDKTELEPCPFCGGKTLVRVQDEYEGSMQVDQLWCARCGAKGPNEVYEHKKWEWNTRTAPDLKAAEAQAFEKAVSLVNTVDHHDRPTWANAGSWAHCAETYAMRIRALIDPEAPALLALRDGAKKAEGTRELANSDYVAFTLAKTILKETEGEWEPSIPQAFRILEALIAATEGESE